MCPANKAIEMAGTTSTKPIKPNDNGSFVKEYTSHSTMINCIDQPKTRMNLIIRKKLNSLNLKAAYGSNFSSKLFT